MRLLLGQPNGAECGIAWLRLLDAAAKHPVPGTLPFTDDTTDQDIAGMLSTTPEVVSTIRAVMARQGKLEQDGAGHAFIPELSDMVGRESASARRMRGLRERAAEPQLLDTGEQQFQLLPPGGQTPEEMFVRDAVLLFNELRGTKYKTDSDSSKKLLGKLFRGGYTIEDVAAVVGSRIAAWKDNDRMRDYLTPDTLFAEKNFEKYLNNHQQALPAAKQERETICAMCERTPVKNQGDVCDECRTLAATSGTNGAGGSHLPEPDPAHPRDEGPPARARLPAN
jgi:uncharacterized phage protein (TIGR02220 family)